jgi:uncharacterized protein YqeY
MNNINQKISLDIQQAMRDKNPTKLNVLRSLKTAIMNASLQKGNVNEPLSEVEVIGIIRKQLSQRQDSIAQFITAQRNDLIATEEAEVEVLKEFLPEELSELQLETYIVNTISELGATSKKDMGNVIKRVVHIVNGRADNKTISKIVGEKLQ